ncbi:antibiotic biosynthesis monooxygenase [Sphaerisporangium rufum]|uniref:Antibiotic biosynthesis monooxygenase n=1 Tax=Sphaerisporangium rufum TaxID=1381558 RepID=A0A919R830_9ACTN|nr:antibiotic biosynthesis monooxygenase family protein [Sphaerisporangium rufum]GII80973.1 antibiotic biosynthesis monooxygenase [Sphaerisporangium rufum]
MSGARGGTAPGGAAVAPAIDPSHRVRVVVWYRAPSGDDAAVLNAYHGISRAMAGTPGLLGNELLRSVPDRAAFAVMSEWENFEVFDRWERGPDHQGTTAPLVPYLDRAPDRHFELYEVTAAY